MVLNKTILPLALGIILGFVSALYILAVKPSRHVQEIPTSQPDSLRVKHSITGHGDSVVGVPQDVLVFHGSPTLSGLDNGQGYSVVHDNWMPPALPGHLQQVDQTDPDMIRQIRDFWILAPDFQPLNLTNPDQTYFAQDGQDMYLDKLFRNKTNGFYVECGAFTGEQISNTLYFERERGWNGLLIEPNPVNFATIISKHRNALLLNTCLSPMKNAETLNFTNVPEHPYLSRFEYRYAERHEAMRENVGEFTAQHQTIQCFPTYSILTALDQHVDFFSLDIETAEVDILKTLPFDKIDVDVFLIETCSHGCPRFKEIQTLMKPYGYKSKHIPGDTYDIVMSKI